MDVDDHPAPMDVEETRHDDGDEDEDVNRDEEALDTLRPHTVSATAAHNPSRSVSIATSLRSSTPSHINPFLSPMEPTPPKTIKLLYIPDPTRSQERLDVGHSLSWVKRYLTDDQVSSIQHLRGFHVKARVSRDDKCPVGRPYRMGEWVSGPSIGATAYRPDIRPDSCGPYYVLLTIGRTTGSRASTSLT